MSRAITHARVFDGERLLADHAVILDQDRIAEVLPSAALPADIPIEADLNGAYLTPGFIDLQVNGGGGVLFNGTPTAEAIRAIGAAHRRYGTTGFLPTLISDDYAVMRRAVAAVDEALARGAPGVLGIHLEGPFLNVLKKGTHDAGKIRALDEEGLAILRSLKRGKTLVTLAPERTTAAMIRRLLEAGVIVWAGHSAADYRETRAALAAGVSGFTHLFNAMTPLQSRAPGMVGAALADADSRFGIIADGHHMHPACLQIAVAAKRRGGAVLVTDAMPTVGAKDKSFVLNNETIHAVDGRLLNAAGSLAGSDLDMAGAVRNAARFARIDWLEAVRMASLYPARALGLADRLGYIKPGYRASLAALNERREVVQTWIDGQTLRH